MAYQKKGKATLKLILGPMFASKTSHLITEVQKYRLAGQLCIIYNIEKDSERFDKEPTLVVTHDNRTDSAKTIKLLMDVKTEALKYDVIAINEGQFFTDLSDFCIQMLHAEKVILVAALNGDSNLEPWSPISKTLPIATDIIYLKAICTICLYDASYSLRLDNSKDKIHIGLGYTPVCYGCYCSFKI